VSEEPRWQLTGPDGEEAHWERLFDAVQGLLDAWREVPELSIERSRAEVSVLGIRLHAPSDWHALELTPDRHHAVAQEVVHSPGCSECPGGLNPTLVFEIERRHPAPDAPRLERVALEHALGSKLAEPEAWSTEDTVTGRKGSGQVVIGDGAKTVAVTWWLWDAGELAWMVRVAAACGTDGPGACDLAWDAMVNGVVTEGRRER
jgi:hypothetical protein